MASEELKVKITAETSGFTAGLKTASSSLKEFVSSKEGLKQVGEGLQNVGKKMTAVGVGIVASVGGIVAQDAKWDASIQSTNFLYNNLDKSVQKAISTNQKNANSIGLTEQQYKRGATSMATYFKNLGITSQESANMSGKTMQLVADLAAVADVPFDTALAEFKSGLMGKKLPLVTEM